MSPCAKKKQQKHTNQTKETKNINDQTNQNKLEQTNTQTRKKIKIK
jgi:hypothetical protein